MFIYKVFGGRSSDKAIVVKTGILDYIVPEGEIMADQSFAIGDLLLLTLSFQSKT